MIQLPWYVYRSSQRAPVKTNYDNSLGRIVLYPALDYKLTFRTRLAAVALGTGLGALIVTAVMVVVSFLA